MITIKDLKKQIEDLNDDDIIVGYLDKDSSNDEPDIDVINIFADRTEGVLVLELRREDD